MPLPAVLASVLGGAGGTAAGATVSSTVGAAASNAAAGAAANAVTGSISKMTSGMNSAVMPGGLLGVTMLKLGKSFADAAQFGMKFVSEIDNVGQTIRNVGAMVTAPMRMWAETIEEIPVVGKLATINMRMALAATDAFFGVMSMFPDMLKTAGDMAKKLAQQYVQVFSPNTVKLFQRAVDDLDASIGENLIPVIRLAQQGFRYFADKIAGMTSTVQPAIQSIMNEFKEFAKTFDPLIVQISTLGKIAFKVAGELAPLVSALGKMYVQMTPLYKVMVMFGDYVAQLAARLGIDMSDDTGKSTDKAYKQASTTSISSIIAKTQENAYGLGKEGAAEATAKNTATSAEFLTGKLIPALFDIYNSAMDRLITALLKLPFQIGKAMLVDVPKWIGTQMGKSAAAVGTGTGNLIKDTYEATKTVGKPGESFFDRVGRMRSEREESASRKTTGSAASGVAAIAIAAAGGDPLALRADMRGVLPATTTR